jgi:hypothetical protein
METLTINQTNHKKIFLIKCQQIEKKILFITFSKTEETYKVLL